MICIIRTHHDLHLFVDITDTRDTSEDMAEAKKRAAKGEEKEDTPLKKRVWSAMEVFNQTGVWFNSNELRDLEIRSVQPKPLPKIIPSYRTNDPPEYDDF